jgi:hypothetical protein
MLCYKIIWMYPNEVFIHTCTYQFSSDPCMVCNYVLPPDDDVRVEMCNGFSG